MKMNKFILLLLFTILVYSHSYRNVYNYNHNNVELLKMKYKYNKWKLRNSKDNNIYNEKMETNTNNLGFSLSLSTFKPFSLLTNILYGSNAIEHGINMIEEELNTNNRDKNVLVLVGWNPSLADPIFWELEPRGFNIMVHYVNNEPNSNTISDIIKEMESNIEVVIAMGTGAVMDAAKIIVLYLNYLKSINNNDKNSNNNNNDNNDNNNKNNNDKNNKNKNSNSGIDISTNKTPIWLQELLDEALEKKIICNFSLNNHDSNSKNDKVLFVTIPNIPCSGAEVSDISVISKILPTSSLSSKIDTMISNEIMDYDIEHHKFRDLYSKEYIKCQSPTICLIQPDLAYKSARMDTINYRIMSLISTCIDIIFADPGYLPEMLVWDSLQQLIPLLDASIQKTEVVLEDYRLNSTKYTEKTTHDDLHDPRHLSQFFRRYGHSHDIKTIENLIRISSAIATAKTSINVCGLQFLVDTIGASTNRKQGNCWYVSHLFPKYLKTILDFSDDIAAREDPYKAFLRVKIEQICTILGQSSYLSRHAPNKTFNEFIAGFKKYLPILSGIRKNILYEILPLEPLHITERDCTGLKLIIKQLAPESPLAHLSAAALHKLLYNEGDIPRALNHASDSIIYNKQILESLGLIEDDDDDDDDNINFWSDTDQDNMNKMNTITKTISDEQ